MGSHGDEGAKIDTERGELSAAGTSVRVRWRVETLPTGADCDRTALIQFQLCNPAPVDQRVRVQNQLDGPVLFPRRRGVPEAGWDREGFVGTVPATEQWGLGYACPAPIETPPISIEAAREPTSVESVPDPDQTPAEVVRTYGEGTPPATVVASRADRSTPTNERATANDREQTTSPNQQDSNAALPLEVTAWLNDVEARIASIERLQGPALADATAALVETDGLDPALETVESLPDDAAALRAIATRATALAERAEEVDVPAEALRRLT
jgi:hypothetical protein